MSRSLTIISSISLSSPRSWDKINIIYASDWLIDWLVFNAVSTISQPFTRNNSFTKLNLREYMYDFLFVYLLLSVLLLYIWVQILIFGRCLIWSLRICGDSLGSRCYTGRPSFGYLREPITVASFAECLIVELTLPVLWLRSVTTGIVILDHMQCYNKLCHEN